MLKSGAAVAGIAAAGPWVLREGHAASGTVKVFSWAGYISPEMLADFEKKTGIKATLTEYGTNDELLNQLKATGGAGFDIIHPTVDRVPNYVEFDLVQPLDESKVKWDGCLKSSVDGSAGMGGVVGGKRYFAPADWGTEALAYDMKKAPLKYGEASYGDLWKPEHAGKVTVRGHSSLIGIALWLESQGKLPHPVREQFKDEAKARANFDAILKVAAANKKSVAQFWTNENEAQGAFRTNGCVIGQTWDSSAVALRKEGLPVRFIAPKEGALAWMEGFAIPKKAENLENAYAWINWFYTPEAGALYTNHSGISSTAVGAEAHLSDLNKQFFADAYPGDALQKLWWWPIQEAWYVSIRNEYQDRFLAA
ncbi:spermidine/putrescine ABC transporter substrate-binding protein [Azospirillum thermophilum]|uniref:Spermidine/putrescine ABC transporter substrate-binding protein n=1 Tax=Azospirillum thermophilum TaxID=2202148 RepID=A0A2S2CUC5_9PROT|nr:spermidine/putrescine ABC transporter substrate-binding protein [Azospirillum thermophilum]